MLKITCLFSFQLAGWQKEAALRLPRSLNRLSLLAWEGVQSPYKHRSCYLAVQISSACPVEKNVYPSGSESCTNSASALHLIHFPETALLPLPACSWLAGFCHRVQNCDWYQIGIRKKFLLCLLLRLPLSQRALDSHKCWKHTSTRGIWARQSCWWFDSDSCCHKERKAFTIRLLHTRPDRLQRRAPALLGGSSWSFRAPDGSSLICRGLREVCGFMHFHALWPWALRERRDEEELQRHPAHQGDRGRYCTCYTLKLCGGSCCFAQCVYPCKFLL